MQKLIFSSLSFFAILEQCKKKSQIGRKGGGGVRVNESVMILKFSKVFKALKKV